MFVEKALGDRRNQVICHGSEGRHASERCKGCFWVLISLKSLPADGGFLACGRKGNIASRPQADGGGLLSPPFPALVDEHPQPF